MKFDLSNSFLNGKEDVTAALAPSTTGARWGRRAVLVAILLPVIGYLILIGSALREQFRPTVSQLDDGWFLVTNRDHSFQFELPAPPSQRTDRSIADVQYSLYGGQPYYVTVRSCSVARQLLNKTATKFLQETALANRTPEEVTVLGSGVLELKTYWIESKVGNGPSSDRSVTRRRLMIHDKQLLELTVEGTEAAVMGQDVDRIMNSARWISR